MVVVGEVAEEWEALENGSRWRMGGGAGEWESLENGSRWRITANA